MHLGFSEEKKKFSSKVAKGAKDIPLETR